jgi:hypothetical protein
MPGGALVCSTVQGVIYTISAWPFLFVNYVVIINRDIHFPCYKIPYALCNRHSVFDFFIGEINSLIWVSDFYCISLQFRYSIVKTLEIGVFLCYQIIVLFHQFARSYKIFPVFSTS